MAATRRGRHGAPVFARRIGGGIAQPQVHLVDAASDARAKEFFCGVGARSTQRLRGTVVARTRYGRRARLRTKQSLRFTIHMSRHSLARTRARRQGTNVPLWKLHRAAVCGKRKGTKGTVHGADLTWHLCENEPVDNATVLLQPSGDASSRPRTHRFEKVQWDHQPVGHRDVARQACHHGHVAPLGGT